MKFNEEYIAENLHENLKRYFKGKGESIQISIEGEGVHWHCNLASQNRRAKINCFEHRHYEEIKPEYLISFDDSEQNKAWGRTHDIEETICSAEKWINNKEIEELHEEYEFIDWYKRKIQEIESQLLTHQSTLKKTEKRLITTWGSGLYDYKIRHKNRSCKLSGYGKTEPISFEMEWDDCRLFEIRQNDCSLLADVLKKWLIDEIEPTKLEREYDWIEVGQLAKYYEIGEGLKGELIESWNSIEKFYKQIHKNFAPKVLRLIKGLRQKGFDERLRAGQSLYTFKLSRSRRHGLTQEQNFIAIRFRMDKDEMIVTNKEGHELLVSKIEISDEFIKLFEGLTKEEIN